MDALFPQFTPCFFYTLEKVPINTDLPMLMSFTHHESVCGFLFERFSPPAFNSSKADKE